MPPPGLDNLKHVVVLMMENRSFDHMLGGLRAVDPRIDGLTGNESNPDPAGTLHKVEAKAKYQSQLDPDPNHDFAPVDQQIFNGGNVATMQGFVKSYFAERQDADHARQIMYYFKPDRLPVLTTLAREYAVFNRWFSSIPGPTLCNRAFAHYGTSFGHVGMELFYLNVPFRSIYQRLEAAGRTAKIYFFDQVSSTMEIVNLIQNQPQFFGTFEQFLQDCQNGQLPDYSFVEPNYTDHDGPNGRLIASDQHPDHHVLEGERYIAQVYNAIRTNPALWGKTVASSRQRTKSQGRFSRGTAPIRDTASLDADFVRRLLRAARGRVTPSALVPSPDGATDIRLFRVWVEGGRTNMRFAGVPRAQAQLR